MAFDAHAVATALVEEHVSGYTTVRNGRMIHVSGYERGGGSKHGHRMTAKQAKAVHGILDNNGGAMIHSISTTGNVNIIDRSLPAVGQKVPEGLGGPQIKRSWTEPGKAVTKVHVTPGGDVAQQHDRNINRDLIPQPWEPRVAKTPIPPRPVDNEVPRAGPAPKLPAPNPSAIAVELAKQLASGRERPAPPPVKRKKPAPKAVRDMLKPGLQVVRWDERKPGLYSVLLRDKTKGDRGYKSLELSTEHGVVNRSDRWSGIQSATSTYDLWARDHQPVPASRPKPKPVRQRHWKPADAKQMKALRAGDLVVADGHEAVYIGPVGDRYHVFIPSTREHRQVQMRAIGGLRKISADRRTARLRDAKITTEGTNADRKRVRQALGEEGPRGRTITAHSLSKRLDALYDEDKQLAAYEEWAKANPPGEDEYRPKQRRKKIEWMQGPEVDRMEALGIENLRKMVDEDLADLANKAEDLGRDGLLKLLDDELARRKRDFIEGAAGHTSVMVGLFPSPEEAKALALKGGEKADQLHVTLAFLGKDVDTGERLHDAVRGWAATCPPLSGEYSGWGRFFGGEDGTVGYLSLDLPQLPAQRQRLVDALELAGAPASTLHGFTPHMTLAYDDRDLERPANPKVTFDSVWLCIGDERHEFPLRADAERTLDEAMFLVRTT